MLASIPSPGRDSIDLGPLHLRAYGLIIALGVYVAVQWARARWEAKGGKGSDITDLAVVAIVLFVERRFRLRPGRLFAVYVAAYTFGRFWIELLRIDLSLIHI